MTQSETDNLAARIADELRARYILQTVDRGSLIPRDSLIRQIASIIRTETR